VDAILGDKWTTDLKARRIRVNAVSPGTIDTPGLNDLLASAVGSEKNYSLGDLSGGAKAAERNSVRDHLYAFLSCFGAELFVDGGFAQV